MRSFEWQALRVIGLVLIIIPMVTAAARADGTQLWFRIDGDAGLERSPQDLTDTVTGSLKLKRVPPRFPAATVKTAPFSILRGNTVNKATLITSSDVYRMEGGCPYTDVSQFTLECWLYWTGAGGNEPLERNPTAVVWGNYDTAGLAILVHTTDGKIGIRCGTLDITTTAALPYNKWAHVAVVKSNTPGENTGIWLNGEKKQVISLPPSLKISDAFTIGGHDQKDYPGQWWRGGIDEVRLSDRALTPDEFLTASSTLHENPALRMDWYSDVRVKISADFGWHVPDGATAVAEVTGEDGASAGVRVPLNLTSVTDTNYGFLDVKPLKPAAYSVQAKLLRSGETIAQTAEEKLEIGETEKEWLTNTYGQEDIVIQGFKPLKAEGTTVVLWGREYDFGDSIMPAQITNQGRKMLARPINWFARTAGPDYALRTREIKLVAARETRAVYEAKGAMGPLSVTAEITVEYDGFMKYEITFDPGAKPVTVEELFMDIPLVPRQCTNLYHPTRREATWTNGWKSPFMLAQTNSITLGTPDICLQWMTESDQHYYPQEYGEVLETLEERGARIFRTNVIGESKRIEKPFTLTFALEAGPVRPRPANWRGWVMNGRRYLDPALHTSVSFNYFVGWWSQTPGSLIPRESFPVEELKDRVDGTSMHFAGFRHFEEKDPKKLLPEWEKHESEWLRVPRCIHDGEYDSWPAPGFNHKFIDPNSSWGQWHVYNCYKLFSETGFRGLYYDNYYPPASMNEAAGSGYIDENGTRRPVNPIFSQREIHRRVYAIVKRFRPDDGLVIIHTSVTTLLPIVSFCDIIYDGECMCWNDLVPPGGNFFDTFRNDFFQVLFSCKQYGPIPAFHDETGYYLAKVGGIVATMPKQRQLWAKWLTHDIHAIAGLNNPNAEALLCFWLDDFGIADPDVTFHPYWEASPAVKVLRGKRPPFTPESLDGESKMWAVAYSKPGKVLVVVVRDAPNDHSGTVTLEVELDRKRLALPEGPLTSMDLETLSRTRKGVIEGNVLKVPVGVDDFSAVVIKPEAKK
jgi:hypothetical protein